ncbi:hypothetical protein [Nocardioides mangrovicus]|nr:hypothetical protein [Nocardioides mangrovicus]
MITKRILAVIGAVTLAGSLAAGPAQAASDNGARKKAHTHVGVSVVKDATYGWDIQVSLKRRGAPYAGKVLIVQSKVNGKWKKVRSSAIRTDANGAAAYPAGICVHKVYGRAYNPVLRVHFNGDRNSAEGNSRKFRAPCR